MVILNIKHAADILSRRMVFRALAPNLCIKKFLKFEHGFMHDCYLTIIQNSRCENCAFPVKIMLDFRI